MDLVLLYMHLFSIFVHVSDFAKDVSSFCIYLFPLFLLDSELSYFVSIWATTSPCPWMYSAWTYWHIGSFIHTTFCKFKNGFKLKDLYCLSPDSQGAMVY